MKKLYSLMALLAVATIGFVAQAWTVTLKFTDPNGVFQVQPYAYGSPTKTVGADGTVEWSESDGVNIWAVLDDGVVVTEVKDQNNGNVLEGNGEYWSISEGADYSQMGVPHDALTVFLGYAINSGVVSDGDTVVINNGGNGGGGDSDAVPADVVRFQFTNPSDAKVYLGSIYGDAVELTGNYVDWTESMGNPCFQFVNGARFNGMTNKTTDTVIDGDFYNYSDYMDSYSLYFSYGLGNAWNLGDLIVVNNGEGGGDTPTPVQTWKYTVICTPSVVNVESSDLKVEVASTNDAYYVYATNEQLESTFTISGDAIESVDMDGNYLSPVDGVYTVTVDDYQKDCTFYVTEKKIFTVVCPEDVLTFTGDRPVTATYADGQYTVSGFQYSLEASVKNAEYVVKSVTASAGTAPMVTNNGKGIYFYAYNASSGTVYTVTLGAAPVTYTFNCAEDVLTFIGNPESAMTSTYNNGAYTVVNSGLNVLGVELNADAQSAWEIESVTVDGVALEGVTATTFTVPVSKYTVATTFDVALKALEIGGGDEPVDNIITIVVTDQNYISAKGGSTNITFTDNKAEYDLNNGTNVTFTTVNGAMIQTITTDAVNNEGYAITISTNTNLPASNVTAYLSELPAGATVTVNMSIPEQLVYNFEGPEGIKVVYNGVQAAYNDGVYTVSNLESTKLWYPVQITVEDSYADQLELVSVTKDGEVVGTPDEYGMIEIQSYAYATSTDFVINTKVPEVVEKAKMTVELLTGLPFQVYFYVNNTTNIDFYNGMSQEVEFDPSSDIMFITSYYGQPYQVLVDGVEIPTSEWQPSDVYYGDGYTIQPGSEFYPKNGSKVQIYFTKPVVSTYKVSFGFANEGTETFLSQVGVGYSYLEREEWENGLELNEGDRLMLEFNTADYTINTITLNGENVTESYPTRYENNSVDSDLEFLFDVTKTSVDNIVTVVSEGWEHVVVTDPDQNSYTLTAESTELLLSPSVERLRFTAAEGWEIPEGGVVATTQEGVSTKYNQGDGIFVENGMTVNVTINQSGTVVTPASYKFYCEADVLEFTGYPNDPTYVYSEGANGESGFYTVTNLPETSLYGAVKEEFQTEQYQIDNVTYDGGTIPALGNFYNFSISPNRMGDVTVFTVNFKANVVPRNITIDTNNATCIGRIYNNNVTMTTFPATYDLNDGTTITIEATSGCQINGVTIAGLEVEGTYPTSSMELDLSSAAEGDIVYINASTVTGDYVYTFIGAEGISIKYRTIEAEWADNVYTLDNIMNSNDYSLSLQVASGYENSIVLESVTDGTTTWQPAGAEGVITIPGSELPKANTQFILNTRKPSASETTRTVYLTIDDTEVVSDMYYQGGSSARLSFDADGSIALTITPQQNAVGISTTRAVTSIETDVEGTFTVPVLPSTSFSLDLTNAEEGQTISLYTESITLDNTPEISVDAESGKATVSVVYTVSANLVGQTLTVLVNDKEVDTVVPTSTHGTLEVEIDGLTEEPASFVITLKSAHYEDNIDLSLSGVVDIFVDFKEGVDTLYNLQGVKINPENVSTGFYILNGKTTFIRR